MLLFLCVCFGAYTVLDYPSPEKLRTLIFTQTSKMFRPSSERFWVPLLLLLASTNAQETVTSYVETATSTVAQVNTFTVAVGRVRVLRLRI